MTPWVSFLPVHTFQCANACNMVTSLTEHWNCWMLLNLEWKSESLKASRVSSDFTTSLHCKNQEESWITVVLSDHTKAKKNNFAKAPILPAILPWRFGDPGHVRVKQLRTQKYRIRSYIFLNLWYTNTGRQKKEKNVVEACRGYYTISTMHILGINWCLSVEED